MTVLDLRRALVAGALLLGLAALTPAPAAAVTTVQRSDATVAVTGDDARNHIEIDADYQSGSEGMLLIRDFAADTIAIGPGCTPAPNWGENYAHCGPAGTLGLLAVSLGGGDDEFSLDDAFAAGLNRAYQSSVQGGAGDDKLTGYNGTDVLRGGPGNDVLHGHDGDDLLYGDAGNDEFYEAGGDISGREFGNDRYYGGAGRDTFLASGEPGGRDIFVGGSGFDEMSYGTRFSRVVVRLDKRANDGARGERDKVGPDIERVVGGSGDDLIVGNNRRNVLVGQGGDDVLDARDGRGGDRVSCDFPVDSGNDVALIDRGDITRRGFCNRIRVSRRR